MLPVHVAWRAGRRESGQVDRQQWDARYSGAGFEWSMHPNQFLTAELDGTPPGRAVDLEG